MSTQFLSQAGAYQNALLRQTYLVNSVLHLFQVGITPGPLTTLAQLSAHEANFDSYAPKIIATWPNIVNGGSGQFILFPATQVFEWVSTGANTSNSIAGWYTVDAAGNLVDVFIFDTPVSVAGPFDAVVVTPTELLTN